MRSISTLAMRLGLSLFTRDNNLRAAAGRMGVALTNEETPRPGKGK